MTPINNDIAFDKPGETKAVTRETKIAGLRRRLRFEPSDTLCSIPEDRSVADFEISQIFKIIPRKEMKSPNASQNQSLEKSGED